MAPFEPKRRSIRVVTYERGDTDRAKRVARNAEERQKGLQYLVKVMNERQPTKSSVYFL